MTSCIAAQPYPILFYLTHYSNDKLIIEISVLQNAVDPNHFAFDERYSILINGWVRERFKEFAQPKFVTWRSHSYDIESDGFVESNSKFFIFRADQRLVGV